MTGAEGQVRGPRGGFWHFMGGQLAHPRGLGGRAIGLVMAFANRRPLRLAVEALEPAAGDHVLDLGCGGGESLAMIAPRVPGGFVQGVDASPLMLARAARVNRAALRQGRVGLAEARFESLPFADAAFDRVLAANVMYFWRDAEAIAAEIRRVLRPGGRLVAYVTDAGDMRRWKFASGGSHRLFDAAALRSALAGGGFDPVRVTRHALPGGLTGLVGAGERPAAG